MPVRADLGELPGYHSPQVDADVRLNTNESPFAPPAAWLGEYLDAVAGLSWNRYPDRQATALRTAIAGFHGVAAERVFAANGSNEVIQSLLLAYAGAGRRVVVFEPTYQLHGHIARITGATVVAGERRDDFTLDPSHAADVIAGADPAVTFLCSPNNPTGVIESPDIVDVVVAEAGGLVVVDEAYAEFSSWSALDRVNDDGRLVVVRTFSKTWSMAAARLGYAVAPRWVVEQLDKVVLAVSPRRRQATRRDARRGPCRRHGATGEHAGRRARSAGRRLGRPRRRWGRGLPVWCQLHPRALPPARRWRRLATPPRRPASSSATAVDGRGSTGACG